MPLIVDARRAPAANRPPLWGGEPIRRVLGRKPKSGHDYSTVTESRQPSQQNEYSEGLRYFLSLSIEFNVTDLWVPHYSQHQQFLFETISKFRAEGWSYKKISKWFNEQNILTPRGKQFIPPSVFSIIKKKKISNERFNRTFQPTINKADIKIQNSNPTNFD